MSEEGYVTPCMSRVERLVERLGGSPKVSAHRPG